MNLNSCNFLKLNLIRVSARVNMHFSVGRRRRSVGMSVERRPCLVGCC